MALFQLPFTKSLLCGEWAQAAAYTWSSSTGNPMALFQLPLIKSLLCGEWAQAAAYTCSPA